MDHAIQHPRSSRVPLRLLSENALGRWAVAGDSRAFEEIFRRYHQELYRYCRSIAGNGHDASDALQSTMTKALLKLPGESRDMKLKPWLFRVAHNECINILQSSKATAESAEIEVESSVRIESEAANRELLRQVLSDIDRLPANQRSALVMRELNGLKYGDIAVALEISAAAARQTVYEARLSLQELERGRTMRCEEALRAISSRDGRVMRARKLKAHLRSCEECEAFRVTIENRQKALRSLVPILPAAAAASILSAAGGGGGGFGGGLLALFGGGGAAGAGAGAGAGAKTVTVVAVALGLGAGSVGVVEGTRSDGSGGGAPVSGSSSDVRVPVYAEARDTGTNSLIMPAILARERADETKAPNPEASRSGPSSPRGAGGSGPGSTSKPAGPDRTANGNRPESPAGRVSATGSGSPGKSGAAPGHTGGMAANGAGGGQGKAVGQAGTKPNPSGGQEPKSAKPVASGPPATTGTGNRPGAAPPPGKGGDKAMPPGSDNPRK